MIVRSSDERLQPRSHRLCFSRHLKLAVPTMIELIVDNVPFKAGFHEPQLDDGEGARATVGARRGTDGDLFGIN